MGSRYAFLVSGHQNQMLNKQYKVIVMIITNNNPPDGSYEFQLQCFCCLFIPVDLPVTSESGFPTSTIVIIAGAVVGGLLLLVTLAICLVIFRMHQKTADMDSALTNMNYDDSSIESPSLRKKADSDEPDVKASNDSSINGGESPGPDLRKDELEKAEHLHELLPKERRSSGHSLKSRNSLRAVEMRSLKRTQSRDSHRAFEVGGVCSLERTLSHDGHRTFEVGGVCSLKRSQSQDSGGVVEVGSRC